MISPKQDSYSSNGAAAAAAAEALQHQEPGPDTASLRVATSVISDPEQQQQSNLEPEQGQGQNGAASPAPSWTSDLKWDSQSSPDTTSNGIAIEHKVIRNLNQAAKNSNGDIAITHPAEQLSNLDSRLDFDNGDTRMLLRAYNSRVAAGRLHAALEVLESLVAAGRTDVLKG